MLDLGINCIYLNPIFKALSFHKYDTVDYYDIDPCFGTKNDFKKLVEICHENNIKVILDGVFNHTSPYFFAFKDIIEKDKESKYYDWYLINNTPVEISHPPNYEAFAYVPNMPRLNTANDEVIDYFINVGKYWLSEFDIDGWRLDVANEIDHNFWIKFRTEIKKINSEAIIIGEIWEDAPSFLQGNQFDSVMDYNFMNICEQYFAKSNITASLFLKKLSRLKMRYKSPIQNSLLNFLDTHDVRRFLYVCDNDIRKLKLALLFQFTQEGIPSIFYGDEIGLTGYEEHEYRRKMEWNFTPKQQTIFNYYKKIISIRKKYNALRKGSMKILVCNDAQNIIVFEKKYYNEKLLIAINNSEVDQQITIDLNLSNQNSALNILNNEIVPYKNGTMQINLGLYSACIIDISTARS